MTLHWHKVRRARRLAMPLPPKPKRPLGPPVLFYWGDVVVRTRVDIEAAGHTWDEFLDAFAGVDDLRLVMLVDVLQPVPSDERQNLHHDIRRRRREHQERQAEENRMRRFDQVAREPWFQRFRKRA